MMSFTWILAASVGLHAAHERGRDDCRDCGAVDAAVREKVVKLRTASLWIVRRKAARDLRGYDWQRHPEAVEALADAVRYDRQRLVRQEAVESLGKMKPCLPVAHEALACAAEGDPSLIARCAARKALKSVSKTCLEPCDVCEQAPPGVEVEEFHLPMRSEPVELIVPPVSEPSLGPLESTSLEMPALPATSSPFRVDAIEGALPPPRRGGRPMVHPEDALPLVAPTAPLDRYDPFPKPAPTPADDDVLPPTPSWPR